MSLQNLKSMQNGLRILVIKIGRVCKAQKEGCKSLETVPLKLKASMFFIILKLKKIINVATKKIQN